MSDDPAEFGATKITTAINIINNILGGALLVMPTAMLRTSLIPGIGLLSLVGVMSCFSMYLLVICATKSGQYSYKGLLAVAYSSRVAKAFEWVMFLYPFGVLIAYSRVIGDATLPVARWAGAEAGHFTTERWFWLVMAGIIFWILSSLKNLSNLKFTSFLGTGAVIYVGVMIFGLFLGGTYREGQNGGQQGHHPGHKNDTTLMTMLMSSNHSNGTSSHRHGLVADDVTYFKLTGDFFQAIPVCSMAFSCHYNVPAFYLELKNRSPKAFIITAVASLVTCFITYLCSGIGGMLMMGDYRIDHSQGDILNTFRHNDIVANIGRLGMVIAFLCSFPAVAIAARRSFNQIFFGNPVQKQWVYILEALGFVVVSAVAAFFIPGVDIVVELFGAAFGISIVVIVPCAIYIRVFARGWTPHEGPENAAATSPLLKGERKKQRKHQKDDEEEIKTAAAQTDNTTSNSNVVLGIGEGASPSLNGNGGGGGGKLGSSAGQSTTQLSNSVDSMNESGRESTTVFLQHDIPQLYDPVPEGVKQVVDITAQHEEEDDHGAAWLPAGYGTTTTTTTAADDGGEQEAHHHHESNDQHNNNVSFGAADNNNISFTNNDTFAMRPNGTRVVGRPRTARRSIMEATALKEKSIGYNQVTMVLCWFFLVLGVMGSVAAFVVTVIKVSEGQH